MLQLPLDLVLNALAHYFSIFCRVGGFLLSMPLFGAQLVPKRIRLAFALAFTVLLGTVIPASSTLSFFSLAGFLVIAEQLLIGIGMGFILQMLFQALTVSGEFIAIQNGLAMSMVMDPLNGVSVPSIGQLFLMMGNLLFLALNGHLVVFHVLAQSFETLPIGSSAFSWGHYYDLVSLGSWLFAAALLMSLPTVVGLLMVNFAFGVMSRVAPQLNIFNIGFTFTMVLGLVTLWVSLGAFLSDFSHFLEEIVQYLQDWLRVS